jgi:ribosomal protein S18 acetylase RimI-like enzyme
MQIRRATIKDVDRLKHLKAEFYLWECETDDRLRVDWADKQLKARLARNLKDPKKTAFFIAEEKGVIAGYSGGEIEKTPGFIRHKRRGHLFNLYVKPEYRRKGIAKKLIKAVLDWFKENEVVDIRLLVYTHNVRAHSIYRKLGFEDYMIEMKK